MSDDYEPETVLISLPAWNSMVSRNHELQERIKELEADLAGWQTHVGVLGARLEELDTENEMLRDVLETISTGELNYPEQYARLALLGGADD